MLPMSSLQASAAKAIVVQFETGRPVGGYERVVVTPGDKGGLSYGRMQASRASGNLHLLATAYCGRPDAVCGPALSPFLPRLAERDPSLDGEPVLRRALEQAGQDPLMRRVQDAFIEAALWRPALASTARLGARTPLGAAIVLDSRVHGSWRAMRDRTSRRVGWPATIGERAWFLAFLSERRTWLAGHANGLLRRTVYRIDALRRLAEDGNWTLDLPFSLRGLTFDADLLALERPAVTTPESPAPLPVRLLRRSVPAQKGVDVAELQQALVASGARLVVDGIFGPATEAALRAFQAGAGLPADGIAGARTRAALGLPDPHAV